MSSSAFQQLIKKYWKAEISKGYYAIFGIHLCKIYILDTPEKATLCTEIQIEGDRRSYTDSIYIYILSMAINYKLKGVKATSKVAKEAIFVRNSRNLTW